MTRTDSSANRPEALAELFTHYLRQQVEAQAQGLGFPETSGEVVPHEAVPVQPTDPRQAWEDAIDVVSHFPTRPAHLPWTVAPDWPALVAAQEPAVALAFCLGNFPQMVRNLHPLLTGNLTTLRVHPNHPVPASPGLREWAAQARHDAPRLMAAGVLRLGRHFEEAAELLRTPASAEWQMIQANEEAALAWHRGDADQAHALWLAQEASVPVLFNRGMAALFLGRPVEARAALEQAVAALPETSAWYHLGHLYLALASARG